MFPRDFKAECNLINCFNTVCKLEITEFDRICITRNERSSWPSCIPYAVMCSIEKFKDYIIKEIEHWNVLHFYNIDINTEHNQNELDKFCKKCYDNFYIDNWYYPMSKFKFMGINRCNHKFDDGSFAFVNSEKEGIKRCVLCAETFRLEPLKDNPNEFEIISVSEAEREQAQKVQQEIQKEINKKLAIGEKILQYEVLYSKLNDEEKIEITEMINKINKILGK